MGRTLNAIIKELPKARRNRINARYRALKNEVESLRSLREAVGKAQTDIASHLKISQPSVSKIERQADMYLSTLKGYVEAIGGDLELTVRFPKQEPVRLGGLGVVLDVGQRRAKRGRKRA